MNLLEKSLVGGAFLYLLWFFIKQVSANLVEFGNTLQQVSQTLLKIDLRMEHLEKRVQFLEDRKG